MTSAIFSCLERLEPDRPRLQRQLEALNLRECDDDATLLRRKCERVLGDGVARRLVDVALEHTLVQQPRHLQVNRPLALRYEELHNAAHGPRQRGRAA